MEKKCQANRNAALNVLTPQSSYVTTCVTSIIKIKKKQHKTQNNIEKNPKKHNKKKSSLEKSEWIQHVFSGL